MIMDYETQNSILKRFKRIRVHFPQFNAAHSTLLNAIEETQLTGEPYGAIICGWSGCGKTSLCLHMKSTYKSGEQVKPDGVTRTQAVVYFEVPPTVTIKGMVREMLISLGLKSINGSTEEMTGFLIRLLKKRYVELIFLDEIQRLCWKTADKVRIEALSWITSFANKMGIPVILSGTEECYEIRTYLSAFATRYPYQVNLSFFEFTGAVDSDFNMTLQKLDEAMFNLTGLKNEVHLQDPSIAASLYLGTAGNLGWLRKIIYVALKRSLTRDDNKGLSHQDLYYACESLALETCLTSTNPFSYDLNEALQLINRNETLEKLKKYELRKKWPC